MPAVGAHCPERLAGRSNHGKDHMRIFVSSSFEDLRDHRSAAIRVLRQLGHEVLAMEDMVAGAAAPLAKVLESMIPRVQQVLRQTRERIDHGNTHAPGKIVSPTRR